MADELRATPEVEHVNPLDLADDKWKSLEYRKKAFWIFAILSTLLILLPIAGQSAAVELEYDVVCRYLGVNEEHCSSDPAVNEYLAQYKSINILVTAIPRILVIPFIMAFVERIGLVLGLLFIFSGVGIQIVIAFPLAKWVPGHWSPYRMLILEFASVFTGFTVYTNVMILTISQLFPEADLRPKYTAKLLGTVGLIGFISPSIGAWGSQKLGFGYWFLVSSVVEGAFMLLYVNFVDLPPLVTANDDTASDATARSPTPVSNGPTGGDDNAEEEPVLEVSTSKPLWDSLLEQLQALKVLKFAHIHSLGMRVSAFLFLLWVILFRELDIGDFGIVIMYTKQFFSWHQDGVGALMSINAASSMFWNWLGFPILQSFLLRFYEVSPDGIDSIDKLFIIMAATFQSLGLLMMFSFKSSALFTLGFAIFTCTSCASSIVKPALLKLVPTEDATTFMTAISVIDSITSALIPTLMLWTYKGTLSWRPTMLFEVQFVISTVYLVAAFFLVRTVHKSIALL